MSSHHTAGYLRRMLSDLADETPVLGYVIIPQDATIWGPEEDGLSGYRDPTAEEWVAIADRWERLIGVDMAVGGYDALNDAISELGLVEPD